ncbi:hypothetical protein EVAR_90201_1 [Eumeta japonica]|uniref:Uncharacterized protein n=1 Tax=Eumeta variegata TaxID=151549 RepID=A0A4C1WYJ6_EUMVA|nr:hypothetical protein EVAR_90201_1 [Eumeta japonica]
MRQRRRNRQRTSWGLVARNPAARLGFARAGKHRCRLLIVSSSTDVACRVPESRADIAVKIRSLRRLRWPPDAANKRCHKCGDNMRGRRLNVFLIMNRAAICLQGFRVVGCERGAWPRAVAGDAASFVGYTKSLRDQLRERERQREKERQREETLPARPHALRKVPTEREHKASLRFPRPRGCGNSADANNADKTAEPRAARGWYTPHPACIARSCERRREKV